jgi:hypothetical protein
MLDIFQDFPSCNNGYNNINLGINVKTKTYLQKIILNATPSIDLT